MVPPNEDRKARPPNRISKELIIPLIILMKNNTPITFVPLSRFMIVARSSANPTVA